MLIRLREKPRSYWLISAALLITILFVQPMFQSRLKLNDLQNALFMLLTKSPSNPSFPHGVKLVWIGDDEYWGNELQHRSPTNRFYLARLIRAADAADASVVALDFDLRLPDATLLVRPGDYGVIDKPYRAETDALMRAIGDVAQHRRIVLAKTIAGPINGPFTLAADAYQPYGICTAMTGDGVWHSPGTSAFPLAPAAQRNINCAYIALMDDARQLPPPAHIVGQRARLDSMPLAIARARDPSSPGRFEDGKYVASYIPEAALRSKQVSLSAGDLLRDPAAASQVVQGYAVIIGAAWHLRARGVGDVVDVHDSPIGTISGALVHASLAEAILANRTYPAVSQTAMVGVELVLGAISAVLFALARSPTMATMLLIGAIPTLFGVQWLSLQLFGIFLDLFAPVLGLGLHAVIDRLIGEHGHAN